MRRPRFTIEQRYQRVVDAVRALGGRAGYAEVAAHVGVHYTVTLYDLHGAHSRGLLDRERDGRKHIYVLPVGGP